MSDFEDVFGVGADSMHVIGSLNGEASISEGDIEYDYTRFSNAEILKHNQNFKNILIKFPTFKSASLHAQSIDNRFNNMTLRCEIARLGTEWLFKGIAYISNLDDEYYYTSSLKSVGALYLEIDGEIVFE
ncbi:hypothetical protein [Vibrio campbellii]|uniref:hypothetical protein n=1 Tax=Vibrio campbellii TaxID=680 RepID=UPI003F87B955